ncbi:MAG: DUF5107 domain-containing protein [Acidobacteriaceae bacterium]
MRRVGMLRIFCLVFPVVLAAVIAAPMWAAPVHVEATTIEIPTYLLGPQDPNPPFQLINSRKVYPYTMLDDLTNDRELKKYKALILENAFLRATILPGLGGRLYSLYDKSAHREVFYCNHVIKYGLIGLRGAWISGGIEFNFPNGHTTDTVSPVSSTYQENPDGSATVYVGDVDQVSEMYWQIALTLRPGAARLEQHVTLFNSTPLQKLYWYWDNAATPATADMHFIYPMREVNPDEPGEYWNYPVWKGTDYSQYKNIRKPTELFGVDIHRNFYGAYYPGADEGIVHFADYRDMTGKKLWTWGVAGNGLIWTDLLTDKDGPYNEIQAGRFQTQLNQEFMPPQNVESWTEFWYPVQKLGNGFVEATKAFALNVGFQASAKRDGAMRISISPTEVVQNASVIVSMAGNDIKTIHGLSFTPLVTQSFSIPVEDMQRARNQAVVDILDSAGRTLLHWSAAAPIDGNPDFVSKVGMTLPKPIPEKDLTVQEIFLRGMSKEKEGAVSESQRLFAETLKRDPNYIPALHQLALQWYRAADFDLAETYIKRAIAQNSSDSMTQYLAGIIYRAEGKFPEAQDAFWISVRQGSLVPQSLMELGEIKIAAKDYPGAEQLLRKALNLNPEDVRIQCDLAVALQLQNKLAAADSLMSRATYAMQLYPLALAERWQVAVAQGVNSDAARSAREQWATAVGDRVQSYLEAASWYWEMHDWTASDFVLKAALQRFPASEVSCMVYYYLASNARHEGAMQRAGEFAAKARTSRYEMVFINRLADVAVLQEALHNDASDAHAQYLLGNFLFQYERYQDAEKLWYQARASGFAYSVLDRNLALDVWKIKGNLQQAAKLYQQAIQLAPHDFHLYVDLDEVYTQMDSTQARSALFTSAPTDVLMHDPSRIRYILLLIQKGDPDKAIAMMQDHAFRPWEQGLNVRDIFVYACIQAGRKELAAGQVSVAEENFEHALEYPKNLGIGKPDEPNDAIGLYWLGIAMKKQGNDSGAALTWKRLVGEESESDIEKYYQALALERLGQKEVAKDRLIQLAEGPAKGRESAESYYVAGLAEMHKENKVQADMYFRKALAINPSLWLAQMELATHAD